MDTADQTAAQTLLDDDRHYLGSITRMGDDNEVVAAADIVGSHGFKLLAKGAKIDSAILAKLVGHRLREPIERNLKVACGVSPDELAKAAAAIIDQDAWWRGMANRSGDPMAIRHGLSRTTVPAAICFKLTVAREQVPTLYKHSVRTALLCHFIALRLGLGATQTGSLQLAALCHDLGELHTDPAIFAATHRITDEERRFVYVHPVTGYLIVKQIDGIGPDVANAVLQHHERLDGSGYPRGLRGAAISPLARMLAVADVAESVLARSSGHRRLGTLLRLNRSKYDADAIAVLHDALPTSPDVEHGKGAPGISGFDRRLARLADILSDWAHFRALLGATPTDGKPGLEFLFERIHNINSTLLQSGFDPDSLEALSALAEEDPEVAAELATVLDEMGYQLADMAREIIRREQAGEFRLPADQAVVFAEWKDRLLATTEATPGD